MTVAKWRADLGRLITTGTRTAGTTVNIVNAYDPAVVIKADTGLDSTTWAVASNGPSPVPCRVRAISSDGQQVDRDVSLAPADCAPKGEVTISRAQWTADEGKLTVRGTRNDGVAVTVKNAYDPAQIIKTDRVFSRGTSWVVAKIDFSPIPCRVLATSSDGGQAEMDVSQPPADCAPTPSLAFSAAHPSGNPHFRSGGAGGSNRVSHLAVFGSA